MFGPLVGSDFLLHVDPDHRIRMKLIELTPLAPVTTHADLPIRQDPFSMVFRTVDGSHIDQRTYVVEHPHVGTIEMFVVPIGMGEHEVIFN